MNNMLCEKCGVNQANVHIIKVVNGNKREINLCDRCANDVSDIPSTPLEDLEHVSNSFHNLLSGLVDYINKSSKTPDSLEVKCNNCGMSYREFKKSGFLGCSECYKTFSNTIIPVIKRVQGDVEHVGKVPSKAGKGILERKKILKLKEELQQAILSEEYEKAAMLRDEIRALQEKLGE